MTPIWILAAAILLCVAFSAFFSASEMALNSCNRVRLEHEKEEGSKRAALALWIHDRFDRALSTILVGNNLVNIASSALASVLVFRLNAVGYTWLATLIVTLLVIIFGETIPKILASRNATRETEMFSRPVRVLMALFSPVTRVVVAGVNLLTRGLPGEEEPDDDAAVEELHSIIDTAEDEAVLDQDASELVSAAIDFMDVSVSEVMTARVDMVAIEIGDDWQDILRILDDSRYSRIPVYEDSIDNIIGILSLNRFLKALTEEKQPDLRKLLMPACFVYKTMKLPAVLSSLRNAQQHLAIVTDEYGGTLGVVSMEDVLEEIVGDIWDETDQVEPEIVEKKNGEWELDGDMPVSELTELMGWEEDSFDFESETVGGWCIEMLDGFPSVGSAFTYRGAKVRVLEVEERRVSRVLIIKPEEKEPEEA